MERVVGFIPRLKARVFSSLFINDRPKTEFVWPNIDSCPEQNKAGEPGRRVKLHSDEVIHEWPCESVELAQNYRSAPTVSVQRTRVSDPPLKGRFRRWYGCDRRYQQSYTHNMLDEGQMGGRFGVAVESPFCYVLTNIFVWGAVAISTELLFLNGELIDGAIFGSVGGSTYAVANLLLSDRNRN